MAITLDGTTGITASGNITGSYVLGNGSQLTGIDATSIQNGTSNVRALASGNVTVSSAGVANVAIFTSTGANITGTLNATGNANVGNLGTAGLITATGNITGGNLSGTSIVGTLTTAAQTSITSVGTLGSLSVTGNITGGNLLINTNAIITGNLTVNGTETIFNVANLTVNDKDIIVANNVTGGANVNGAGLQAGNPATATWFFNNATTSWQSNIGITPTANGTLALGGTSNYWGAAYVTTLIATGNANVGNLGTSGNISASYFLGNGSQLTGIDATAIQNGSANVRAFLNGNVTVSAAGTANVLVVTSTGANITGTLNATGNANVGNLGTSGNITGSYFLGNGSQLTGIDATAIQNGSANVRAFLNGNVTVSAAGTANVLVVTSTGANIAGTLDTGTGNANVGNLGAATVAATTLTGTLSTAAQTNITSVGTLTSLAVTGNITSGNLSGTSIVGTLTTAAQTNITSVGTLTSLAVTGNITSGNLQGTSIVGTLTTAAQTNITSVGALNAGSITSGFGAIDIGTDTITVGGIINANGNGVGNIGSSSVYFNTVFAKATSAQYADLAESYTADADYAPGTVLVFGGTQEVTISNTDSDRRIAGVVSTNPSYIMNSGLESNHVSIVALQGRVPTKVTGKVSKGDLMVSAGNGHARAEQDPKLGAVIGKALEEFDGDTGVIEVVVGRI